jgi:hypothetical protein
MNWRVPTGTLEATVGVDLRHGVQYIEAVVSVIHKKNCPADYSKLKVNQKSAWSRL